MKNVPYFFFAAILLCLLSCNTNNWETSVSSPSGNNSIQFSLSSDGTPNYTVAHNNNMVIDTSSMGFDFKDHHPLRGGLQLIKTTLNTQDETWEMPWGEQRTVRNHYNGLLVELEEIEAPNRKLNIHFKAYDDGVAFRYEFPENAPKTS